MLLCWLLLVIVSSSGGAGGRNSRGEFIAITLHSMAGLSAEGSVIIVNQCLPPNSPLVSSVFLNPSQQQHGQTDSAAEKDVVDRLWNTSEDIDFIRQYIISDELSESRGSSMESEGNANGESSSNPMVQPSVWWRSRLVTRALFHPISHENARLARLTKKAWKNKSADTNINSTDNGGEEAMEAQQWRMIAMTPPSLQMKQKIYSPMSLMPYQDSNQYYSQPSPKMPSELSTNHGTRRCRGQRYQG
jgi:hypothetical protein